MSDTDSFIEEVTEEVRRDRLFRLIRRYGWIGVLVVLAIVGGTAWREWNAARDAARAQAFGDGLLAAYENDSADARISALDAVPQDTAGARIVVAFSRASELVDAGRRTEAVAALESIATDGNLPEIYRQIAGFRAVTLDTDMSADERRTRLTALGQAGGVLRLLAEEQLALIDIQSGARDAALERAQRIVADSEVTPGLRRRATQLIVSLGGELPSQVAPVSPETND